MTATTMTTNKPLLEAAKVDAVECGGIFICIGCKIEEKYHYQGQRPPFCRGLMLTEDSYIARDPFSPPGQRSFLLLGSDCSLCSQQVCQDSSCSLFYTKRFCLTCAKENIQHFPTPLQIKIQAVTKK